jgi:hypothetical protein
MASHHPELRERCGDRAAGEVTVTGLPPRHHGFVQNLPACAGDKGRTSPLVKEIGMRGFLAIAAVGSVVATGAMAAVAGLALASSAIVVAAERPSFEVKSFPISPVQMQVVGAAGVREQAPPARLTVGGMPASPAQIVVLAPHRQRVANNAATER